MQWSLPLSVLMTPRSWCAEEHVLTQIIASWFGNSCTQDQSIHLETSTSISTACSSCEGEEFRGMMVKTEKLRKFSPNGNQDLTWLLRWLNDGVRNKKKDCFGGYLLSVRSSTQMAGWWKFFRHQWAINDMLCFSSFGFIRYKEEYDGMQLYLAATENWFIDTGTSVRLHGGVSSLCWAPRHTCSRVGQIQLLWHKCWTYWQKCKME